ncbi:MAG: SpoIIIAH-like family protein [Clostridia bacterium]|nr:SpoIIIAH-like family protein [Clostridia bacterium]
MKNVLKKNQLAILVIALMLVTAGYLNYTSNQNTMQTGANILEGTDYASIGDATLVNSGELLEEKDKQNIINTIQNAQSEANTNSIENTITDASSIQTNTSTEDSDDYFTSSKLERDKMYSQMLETYQKILESTSISQEQKAISEQEIAKINQTKNAIMIAENLISTKGFKNCIIFVNDTSVSVVVKADDLQIEQIAQIQNIISRELKVDVGNIHISNK